MKIREQRLLLMKTGNLWSKQTLAAMQTQDGVHDPMNGQWPVQLAVSMDFPPQVSHRDHPPGGGGTPI